MTEQQTAKVRSGRGQYWLWFVPVIAIVVAAFVVWRNLPPPGESVTVYFTDATGIQPKETRLKYRGVDVGGIEDISLAEDNQQVAVSLTVNQSVVSLLRDNTQFWLVQPQFDTGGVRAINTLVSGPYITFQPGEGEPRRTFTALENPPVLKGKEGVRLRLKSDLSHNIGRGAPVYYKQIAVGQVYRHELYSDYVLFYVQVDAPYGDLVRENSVFWEQGGMEIDASLLGGVSVSADPIASLLQGGIGFGTPDEPGRKITPNRVFELVEEMKNEWREWKPGIDLPSRPVQQQEDVKQPQEELLKSQSGEPQSE